MKVYRCPFCKKLLHDNIVVLAEHRKPGGECDKRMDKIKSDPQNDNI